jgi:hypothetical protein
MSAPQEADKNPPSSVSDAAGLAEIEAAFQERIGHARTISNPFSLLGEILHAALSRQADLLRFPADVFFKQSVSRWLGADELRENADALARQTSPGRGIPFTVVDRALTATADLYRDLTTRKYGPGELDVGWFNDVQDRLRELGASWESGVVPASSNGTVNEKTKPKRSTARGDGRIKLIAAFTQYHQYAKGSCMNPEHISISELARKADVSKSTAAAFFNDIFDEGHNEGYTRYKAICRNTASLRGYLRLLNHEYASDRSLGAAVSNLAAPEEDENSNL